MFTLCHIAHYEFMIEAQVAQYKPVRLWKDGNKTRK